MRNVELMLLFHESSLSDTEPILQINFDHFLTENFKTWTTRTPLDKHTKDGIRDDLDSKLHKWPVQTFQATVGISMAFYLIPWLHHHKIKSKGKGRRRSNLVASVMQKIMPCICIMKEHLNWHEHLILENCKLALISFLLSLNMAIKICNNIHINMAKKIPGWGNREACHGTIMGVVEK